MGNYSNCNVTIKDAVAYQCNTSCSQGPLLSGWKPETGSGLIRPTDAPARSTLCYSNCIVHNCLTQLTIQTMLRPTDAPARSTLYVQFNAAMQHAILYQQYHPDSPTRSKHRLHTIDTLQWAHFPFPCTGLELDMNTVDSTEETA